jgi:hypothetical protein
MLQLRSSKVRDEFNLSASDNLMAPSSHMLLAVLSENEMNQLQFWYRRDGVK